MTFEPLAGTTPVPEPAVPPVAVPWPSPRVAWYAVFVFALTLMINFLDRGIITLLVPSIKADLALSDFQMSLLIGFAFIFFYVFPGPAGGALRRCRPRRTIIGVGIALWSAATALCGLAHNFWQLFVARIGTGVGESCGGPATYSMLSDLFPPHKLPRAIAVMSFGFMVGTGLSLIIGGAIIHFLQNVPPLVLPVVGLLKTWQMTFLLVGLPGLAVSALVFTLPEADPPRPHGDSGPQGAEIHLGAGQRRAALSLRQSRRIRTDDAGARLHTILSIGTLSWGPAFYGRTFGWSMTQVGLISGLVILVVWPVGAMFGSWLAERWYKQGRNDANLRVTLWAILLLSRAMWRSR